ncbi:hypothetical protein SAMN04487895_104406 [Paenibacillus sophorae]|uniref:Uncharacterized protein n=1 Tax=Paenibacillus sophorae TaxID=1333845 RepID=A0A1H8LMB6_9BACL|nr:hypothetical protein [Paenibacillus sophorae]QWU17229.1 hypothetical protein KP014_08740 [Paenibacillus sophorae]SEO06304.1 hypothetical protein SAMN04487895_104406 [Paenibacillus sophorae]
MLNLNSDNKLPLIIIILLLIQIGCMFFLIALFIKFDKSDHKNILDNYTLNLKDLGGSSYIHTEVTPQGDLWIYNSNTRDITYIENPTDSGSIKITEKALSK